MQASGLLGVPGRNRVAAQHVLALRHQFHVVGVDAPTATAEMINRQSVWNRAVQLGPDPAVCGPEDAVPSYVSIARWSRRPHPEVAPGRKDFRFRLKAVQGR